MSWHCHGLFGKTISYKLYRAVGHGVDFQRDCQFSHFFVLVFFIFHITLSLWSSNLSPYYIVAIQDASCVGLWTPENAIKLMPCDAIFKRVNNV